MSASVPASATKVRWIYIGPSVLFFWIVANIDKGSLGIMVANHSFLADMKLTGRSGFVGLALSIFVWVYGVSAFLWGFAVDRYGARKAALASILGWGVAMILAGASAGIGMLMASRVLLGAAEAALWPVSLKLAATWFSFTERGRAKIWYGCGQMAGFAAGSAIVTFLLAATSWRWTFFALAGLALVIVLPLFVFLVRDLPSQHYALNRAEREHIGTEGHDLIVGQGLLAAWKSLAVLVRNYRYWLVIYTFVVSSVASFGLISWLPSYLEEARKFSPGLMVIWTTIAYGIGAAVIIIASFIGDRSGYFAAVGVVSLAIAAICLIGSGLTSQPLVAAPLVAVGYGTAISTVVVTPALLQNYAGAKIHGAASGVMTAVGNLCGGFAPLVIGLFVGAGRGSYAGAFVFLTVVTVLGMACYAVLLRDEISRMRRRPAGTQESNEYEDVTA